MKKLGVVAAMALGGVVGMMAPGGAQAAETPADQGLVLSKQYCATCHVVVPGSAAAPGAATAPPFGALAKDDGWQGEKVAELLKKPHATMPPVEFTPEQIDAFVAYFATMK